MAKREPEAPAPGPLEAYRKELLRWNLQINLLSRRNPDATADALIKQSVEAFEVWWTASGAALASGGPLCCFDLGSGGGLPGFVWLALLDARGQAAQAALVEPRKNRAWFLERVGQLKGAPQYTVLCGRWGEVAMARDSGACCSILVTLKAMRLRDADVLAGLTAALSWLRGAGGAVVEIVRFYPAGTALDQQVAEELGLAAAGAQTELHGQRFEALGCDILGVQAGGTPTTSLVVSRHRIIGGEPGRP